MPRSPSSMHACAAFPIFQSSITFVLAITRSCHRHHCTPHRVARSPTAVFPFAGPREQSRENGGATPTTGNRGRTRQFGGRREDGVPVCPVLSCPVLSCPVLSCPAPLPCPTAAVPVAFCPSRPAPNRLPPVALVLCSRVRAPVHAQSMECACVWGLRALLPSRERKGKGTGNGERGRATGRRGEERRAARLTGQGCLCRVALSAQVTVRGSSLRRLCQPRADWCRGRQACQCR
jgi:hypothetical protein